MRPLTESQKKLLEQAGGVFEEELVGGPAEQYLEGRGIGPDLCAKHRLGYVSADTAPPWARRFAGRLAIPNLSHDGHIVGFKFRALDPDTTPKYDQPAGQVARLFNLRALADPASDTVVLTEGEIDAITLTGYGLPAVGVPGANAWKRHHWRLFEGFPRVVLVQDADSAGDALVKALRGTPLDTVVVYPPEGTEDVNDAHMQGRGDELVAMIHGSTDG